MRIRLFLCFLVGWGVSVSAQRVDYDYVDGKIFVKHTDPLNGAKWDDLVGRFGIFDTRHPFQTPEVQDVAAVYFSRHDKVASLVEELEKWPSVVYAEQVPLYRTTHIPNDTASEQYSIDRIQLAEAWNITRGADSIVIAIIDDAFRLDHEDFAGKVWTNPGEIPNDGIDNDNNGFIDDVAGYDVADDDNDPAVSAMNAWGMAHGTHVAGIAVAATNNGKGIASSGYNCSFIPIKAKADTSVGQNVLQATAEGIDYAAGSGARIVNMSFAGNGASTTIQSIISSAYWQGVTWVAGAGNDNQNRSRFPASYDHVVSVGGTNRDDEKSGFSNWHNTVDVMAPGTGIWSLDAIGTDTYTYMTGSSMSSPMAAGVCGLILSINPGLVYGEVEDYLKMGCENIDAQNPAYVGKIGSGRINAYRSVMAVPRQNAPIAAFSLPADTICQNSPFLIADESAEFPQHWTWDFGDGTTDTTHGSVEHVFTTPGTYSISLIVANNQGNDTLEMVDAVHVLPAPDLQLNLVTGGSAQEFQASGCSTYAWTPANDLSCSDCDNPTVASMATATLFTCLCTSENGCTDVDSIQLPVNRDRPNQQSLNLAPLFPNPTTSSLILQAQFAQRTPLEVTLIDPLGRQIETLYQGYATQVFLEEVELPAGLASGMYLVQWKTDRASQSQRLIVQ